MLLANFVLGRDMQIPITDLHNLHVTIYYNILKEKCKNISKETAT